MKRFSFLLFVILLFSGLGGIALAQDITGITPTSGFSGQTVRVTASGEGFTGATCTPTLESGSDLSFPGTCKITGERSLTFLVTITSGADPGTRTIKIKDSGTLNEDVSFTVSAGEPAPDIIPAGPQTGTAFIDLLDSIVDWVFVIVLVGAGVFIVLAGWQFISAGGEPQNVAQARMKLLYAAIGIGIAVLSQGIVTAIRSLIGS